MIRSSHPGSATQTPRVLVVDRDGDTVESFCLLLRTLSFEPIGATDGAAALRLAVAHKPSYVLMELAIPHINGVELAKALRALPETANARILAVTGLPRAESLAQGAGIDAVLVKPVELPRLLAALSPDAANG